MVDETKRPLHIPPWHIPYLEKHRIFELFHELARELVIQQPDDHVTFIKQVLMNAARARDTARVIIIGSPKVNVLEIARSISVYTKQLVITEQNLQRYVREKDLSKLRIATKIQAICNLVRMENAYERGWILIDCIKSEQEGKMLLQRGILPTHVIHLIAPFQPSLTELLYCHVTTSWPEQRRLISDLREVFKKVLKEVYIQQRSLEEVVAECVNILLVKPSKIAIKPRIALIGPRGSGRKTQAKLLVEKLNLVHVDFERLICEVWMSESDLGEKLRACNNEACLHSEILAQIVNKRFLEEDCLDRGWILTGFPYTETDFKHLDSLDTPPNRVIFLECDLTVCKDRLTTRKMNVHTGSYNDMTKPQESPEKKLATHPKDNPQLVEAELSYYCQTYGNLRKYCGASANFVNADQSQRWVHETIMAIITRAPNVAPPRPGLSETGTDDGSSISSDSCCCTPVPSKIIDCYVTKL